MGKKGDLTNFERGMVVGVRVFHNLLSYWDFKSIAWSDVSRFLYRHSDGRVRIWRKQNENNVLLPLCRLVVVV